MIKIPLISVFAILLSTMTSVAIADDHAKKETSTGTQQPAGVNTLSCNFLPGKDMDDYMKVVNKYNEWADENNPNPQSAWVFIPSFFENRAHDFYWVGASPSRLEAAQNMDYWMENGASLGKQFQKVTDCDQSQLWAGQTIYASDNFEDLPRGMVGAQSCKIHAGKSWSDVGEATRKIEQIVMDAGVTNRAVYRWQPREGVDRSKTDFLNLFVSETMEQRIRNGNMLAEAKAWAKIRDINNSVMSCRSLGMSRFIKVR